MRTVAAKIILLGVAFFVAATATLAAGELEENRKAFRSKLFDIDGSAQTEQGLRENYIGALARLETTRQQEGDFKGMLAIQKEKEQIAAGNIPVETADSEEFAEMRGVFKTARNSLFQLRSFDASLLPSGQAVSLRSAVTAHRPGLEGVQIL